MARSGRVVAGLLLASLLLTGAGCGSDTTSSDNAGAGANGGAGPSTSTSSGAGSASGATGAGAVATTEVHVKNFAFSPQSITVPVGATVTWTFDDSADHTATAVDKSFDSPRLSNGKTFTMTFTKAGTFSYYCAIHQYMTGTVTVTG